MDGTPWEFGHELLAPDIDRIAERFKMSFGRIPAIGNTGIKDMINGPFTFGPDGNPMIGPVPGMKNYWVAGGVPVILNGISFSGELGYELYCKPEHLLRLAEAIESAGAELDYRWYGARALLLMRLEKGLRQQFPAIRPR